MRRWLLIGGQSLQDGAYDSPRSHGAGGLDTVARCELVSVLVGLRLIGTKDKTAYQLLIRDIGRPCRFKIHNNSPGHCHRIPRGELPLVVDMPYEEIDQRNQEAVDWLMSVA